jgi:hypothetical protein
LLPQRLPYTPTAAQALVAAIKGKSKHAAGFADFLEAKYAGGKANKKRDEPSEEEFAAAQARTQRKKRTT